MKMMIFNKSNFNMKIINMKIKFSLFKIYLVTSL